MNPAIRDLLRAGAMLALVILAALAVAGCATRQAIEFQCPAGATPISISQFADSLSACADLAGQ